MQTYWSPTTGQGVGPHDPYYKEALDYYKNQQGAGAQGTQAIAPQGPPPPSFTASGAAGGGLAQGGLQLGGQGPLAGPGGQGPSSLGLYQQASSLADPWAQQRPQYQDALNSLMKGGTSAVSADPSFQNRIAGGQQALERSMAARGFLGSGNIMQELTNYGQTQASDEYQKQYERLSKLAGVDAGSPGTSASILSQAPGQALAESREGFSQGIQRQKLPYELQNLYQSSLQGGLQNQGLQQGLDTGRLEQMSLQQQFNAMEEAKFKNSVANKYSNVPQGFLA